VLSGILSVGVGAIMEAKEQIQLVAIVQTGDMMQKGNVGIVRRTTLEPRAQSRTLQKKFWQRPASYMGFHRGFPSGKKIIRCQ
jgi:hypothetical protein